MVAAGWQERGDELELVSIRRRCTAVDCRFVDEDGDLNPPRAKKPRRSMSNSRDDGSSDQVTSESASDAVDCPDESDCLQLLVRPRTSWRVAGAQIWRAALLLAEFIDAKPVSWRETAAAGSLAACCPTHCATIGDSRQEIFTDATVLELGCGVGESKHAVLPVHLLETDCCGLFLGCSIRLGFNCDSTNSAACVCNRRRRPSTRSGTEECVTELLAGGLPGLGRRRFWRPGLWFISHHHWQRRPSCVLHPSASRIRLVLPCSPVARTTH